MSNRAIWDKVCVTPPAITKQFKGRGGFQGTSANPMYLAQRCTELFGPCGIGWGVRQLEYKIAGAGDEQAWMSHVEFWYRHPDHDDESPRATVQQWGSAMLSEIRGRTSSKPYVFVDPEAAKKAMTNGMSKCLSLLGFCADLWMGWYDSADYQQFAAEKTEERKRMESNENAAALLQNLLDAGIGCKTDEERDKVLSWACGEPVAYNDIVMDGRAAAAQTAIKKAVREQALTYPEVLAAAKKGAK